MAKKPFLYDDQKITVAHSLFKAIQDSPSQSDETMQQVVGELKTNADILEAWQTDEKQRSRMTEVDEMLDACFQGLEHGILAVERKALVKRDTVTRDLALKVYQTLYSKPLSSLIYIEYSAEVTETRSFLRRAQDPQVTNFLREHGMEDWLVSMEAALTEYVQALQAISQVKGEQKGKSSEVGAARKQFDRGMIRLLDYLGAKFPDGHPHAGWRKQSIEEPVEHAVAAARTIQKRRSDESKQAKATTQDSSVQIAWEKKK